MPAGTLSCLHFGKGFPLRCVVERPCVTFFIPAELARLVGPQETSLHWWLWSLFRKRLQPGWECLQPVLMSSGFIFS